MLAQTPTERGLLQLHTLPTAPKSPKSIEGRLQRCLREASDRDGGRDIPMEDFYRYVMTYLPLRPSTTLVRFAMVNNKGISFGNLSLVDTLYNIVKIQLKADNYTLVMPPDERFDFNYQPDVVQKAHPDFLYVKDTVHVRHLIAIKRTW